MERDVIVAMVMFFWMFVMPLAVIAIIVTCGYKALKYLWGILNADKDKF